MGYPEDYYAWEWGDALFVVLDPFLYTERNLRDRGENRYSIAGAMKYSGWDWTLGKTQYDWLYRTLHASRARWKFLFIHHLVSTTTVASSSEAPLYGRGGIEVAKHGVCGFPSFEWGGENRQGKQVFARFRPGWSHGAIHDMLVSEGVTIVFHGHDHFFAKQDLDGIVYQLCPQPVNERSFGYRDIGCYKFGEFHPNSGHLQVTVEPEQVRVVYIRSFLSDEGRNGEIASSYTIR